MPETRRKLVMVGDPGTGKTCLLLFFLKGYFFERWIPTVCEPFVDDINVDGRLVALAPWDTAGHDDYERLRPLTYPGSHVIAIAFSVDKPESLKNVEEKWINEVLHYCLGIPIVLVACKKDLRTDSDVLQELGKKGQRPVTSEEGISAAQSIGAKYYVECSALKGEGVDEFFQYAARASLLQRASRRSDKRRCFVL